MSGSQRIIAAQSHKLSCWQALISFCDSGSLRVQQRRQHCYVPETTAGPDGSSPRISYILPRSFLSRRFQRMNIHDRKSRDLCTMPITIDRTEDPRRVVDFGALESLLQSSEWTLEDWIQVQDLLTHSLDLSQAFALIQQACRQSELHFANTPNNENCRQSSLRATPIQISLQDLVGLWHHQQVMRLSSKSTVASDIIEARQWVELAENHSHLLLPLSISALSLLLHGAVRQGDMDLALNLVDRMVDQLTRQYENQQRNSSSLVALSIEKILQARCANLAAVEELISRYQPYLNLACYNALLQAYAQHGAGESAEQLLDDMCKGYFVDCSGRVLTPDIRSFNIVLNAWSRSTDSAAPERAHAILLRLYDPFDWGALAIKPDSVSWNTVLKAWCRSHSRPDSVPSAIQLLGEMHEYSGAGMVEAQPTVVAYGTVLDAMAKRGQAELAERLWLDMLEKSKIYPNMGTPSWMTASPIIQAWTHSKRADRMNRAEQWIQRVQSLISDPPDEAVHRLLLTCYASERSLAAATKAETALRNMTKPDFTAYSIVIQHWARLPEGFSRALQLYVEVWERYRNGDESCCPDSKSLDSILQLLARSDVIRATTILHDTLRDVASGHSPTPHIKTIGSFMQAYRTSSDPQAPELAFNLVRRLNDLHRAGSIRRGPDHLVYQSLLLMWSRPDRKRKDAHSMALKILEEFRTLAHQGALHQGPTTQDYNMVLRALARNFQPIKASKLLVEMVNSRYDRVRANQESFNAVLWGWAKVATPEALQRMETLLETMKRLRIYPDTVSKNNWIHCLSRMGEPDRAESALRAMKRDKTSPPSPVSYESVLTAWLKLGQLDRAHLILLDFHRECMRGTFVPLERPYQTMILAWEKSDKPDRAALLQSLWKEVQETHATQAAADMSGDVRHQTV